MLLSRKQYLSVLVCILKGFKAVLPKVKIISWYKIQNVGGGTSVLRVVATDRDIGPNAMLFYYITSGNQDLTFRMDRMTGEMVTRPAPPDRERQQEYILTVTVEDDGTPPLSVSSWELQEVHQFDLLAVNLSITACCCALCWPLVVLQILLSRSLPHITEVQQHYI